jgi:uncharacterized membrane protein
MHQGIGKALRSSFLAGLGIVLPLLLSVVVIGWTFNRLTGWLPAGYSAPHYRLASLMLVVVAIATVGWLTRLVIGKRLHAGVESMIDRVPLFNRVYGFFKEISLSVGAQKSVFNRVVLVEYPKVGTYAVAFVTSEAEGEIQAKTKPDVINVFVPTTPNPTSGFLLMVPRNKTIPLEMTVAQGMKLVISGGSIVPPYRGTIGVSP